MRLKFAIKMMMQSSMIISVKKVKRCNSYRSKWIKEACGRGAIESCYLGRWYGESCLTSQTCSDICWVSSAAAHTHCLVSESDGCLWGVLSWDRSLTDQTSGSVEWNQRFTLNAGAHLHKEKDQSCISTNYDMIPYRKICSNYYFQKRTIQTFLSSN